MKIKVELRIKDIYGLALLKSISKTTLSLL